MNPTHLLPCSSAVLLLGILGCQGKPSTQVDDTGEIRPEGLLGCDGMDEAWDELVAYMDELLQEAGAPGGAVAVVCDGKTAYAQGWGTRHQDQAEPITPTTRFQLASSTKMFTGATAMSLVEDGLVDLESAVDTWVPYVNVRDPYDDAATLHQLLSHTAGYPTWFPAGSYSSYVLAHYFENNGDQPLWSAPGAVYNYSNLGMALAGLALEEASGEFFADLVEDRIFQPAGMDGASMHAELVETEGDFAYGHSGGPASTTVTAPTDSYYATGYYGPMGGAWGGVLDLAAWGEVHLDQGGDVLNSESMAKLGTAWTETRRYPEQHYGYGLFIDRLYGYDMLNHGGSVGGFLTHWMLVPEAGFAVVNCDWAYPSYLTYRALDLFVGIESIDNSSYLTSTDDWPAFVGTYVDDNVFGTIEVQQKGDSLVADFVDQGFQSALTGYYEDTYLLYYEPAGYSLYATFWRDEDNGDASHLVTLYGVATRLE